MKLTLYGQLRPKGISIYHCLRLACLLTLSWKFEDHSKNLKLQLVSSEIMVSYDLRLKFGETDHTSQTSGAKGGSCCSTVKKCKNAKMQPTCRLKINFPLWFFFSGYSFGQIRILRFILMILVFINFYIWMWFVAKKNEHQNSFLFMSILHYFLTWLKVTLCSCGT